METEQTEDDNNNKEDEHWKKIVYDSEVKSEWGKNEIERISRQQGDWIVNSGIE